MKIPDVLNIVFILNRESESERRIASGALRYAASKPNWNLAILNPIHEDLPEQARRLLGNAHVDGIVCGCLTQRQHDRIRGWSDAPCVSATFSNVGNIGVGCMIDDAAIAASAADLLVKRGYANFAYVGSRKADFEIFHSDMRQTAFLKRCRKSGFSACVLCEDENLAAQLTSLPKPLGVMAYNDLTARRVVEVCRQARLQIPDQIAVCGVDNEPDICENLRPTLTSVQPDFETGGYRTAEILDHILSGKRTQLRAVFGVKDVVERNSTLALKTGARIVASAQEIIREDYANKISVSELAKRIGVSPSLLHLRFKTITGRTIHAEIEGIRLEKSRLLLQASDMPVNAVAAACGFPSPENFQRRFKRRYGVTPGSCRQDHTSLHVSARIQERYTNRGRASSLRRDAR